MELVEAQRLPGMFLITWTMTRIESCRMSSQITRNWATSCLAQEDFGSFAGVTRRRGKGRRGGLRIIYYYFLSDQQIWLMTLYDKNEASDLTPREKKALQAAIAAELKMRETRRARKK